MYRNRLILWISVLVVFLCFDILKNFAFESEQEQINIQVETDTFTKKMISEYKNKKTNISIVNNNADFIIKNSYINNEYALENKNNFLTLFEKTTNTNKSYEKIENAIYSPIILLIESLGNKPSNIFSKTTNTPTVDFVQIIDAIINDKTISELGFTKESGKLSKNNFLKFFKFF